MHINDPIDLKIHVEYLEHIKIMQNVASVKKKNNKSCLRENTLNNKSCLRENTLNYLAHCHKIKIQSPKKEITQLLRGNGWQTYQADDMVCPLSLVSWVKFQFFCSNGRYKTACKHILVKKNGPFCFWSMTYTWVTCFLYMSNMLLIHELYMSNIYLYRSKKLF